MSSLIYINEKLADAIYFLSIGEGDARTRLAQIIPKIIFLPVPSFPIELQKEFSWVLKMIEKGKGFCPQDFPPPSKLTGITNATARHIIEKILYIQE